MALVYVSSTFSDLQDCRRSVERALARLQHTVRAMEDYVARDDRPLDACLKDVAACDLYIGIFAHRYGCIPADARANPENLSITELEYRTAKAAGKPCLIFVLDKTAAWLPDYMDSYTTENESGRRIKAFRDELMKDRLVSPFKNAGELAELASAAVANWERDSGKAAADQPGRATTFRQIGFHVLLAYSDHDEPAARLWTSALQRKGLSRIRLLPQALLATRALDFAALEQEATDCQCAIALLSATTIDQLRTAPAADTVFSLLDARTGCLIAVTDVAPATLGGWSFSRIVQSPLQPAIDPSTEAVGETIDEIRRRCPTLAIKSVVGLPFVVVAMTRTDAGQIDRDPKALEDTLPRASFERFLELRNSLTTPAASWTERYGPSRLDWRPLGGASTIGAILRDIVNRLNEGEDRPAGDRRIKLQYYPIDPIVKRDELLRPMYRMLAQSGCVAIVDELTLFDSKVRSQMEAFVNSPQVSVITVAPMSPARGAMEEFLEQEARRRLTAPYNRFELDFDPRCEFGIEEERRLKRWLHSSLPDAVTRLREPSRDPQRLATFKAQVRAERQGFDDVLFPQGGKR